MDAVVAPLNLISLLQNACPALLMALTCVILSGCDGRTLVDDNPVFAAAPPRRSLTNSSTVETAPTTSTDNAVRAVSASETSGTQLTGNSIVAEVNGKPIFLDDLIGSLRLTIEADSRITPEQRQKILYAQVRGRLDSYVEQEIVLNALNQTLPEDRKDTIYESLEEPFQGIVSKIKGDRKVQTDAELNEVLAAEGLSIDLLRESFIRMQLVNGYLNTLAPPPQIVDRMEMLKYYKDHAEEFTNTERLRWQEIVVQFSQHDGADGAQKHMDAALKELDSGTEFGAVAAKYSDALSAERRGDMGWLTKETLADQELEAQLFQLQSGQRTPVITRENRLELYYVVDHQRQSVTPFNEVQAKIEQVLKQKGQQDAKKAAMDELRNKATVVTMFDGEQEEEPASSVFGEGNPIHTPMSF